MRSKYCLFLLVLFLRDIVTPCSAQAPYQQINENKNWVFGDHVGLDCNPASPLAGLRNIEAVEGTSSISDAAGQLLMYAVMDTIWNRNGVIMPNAHGLLPVLPMTGQNTPAISDASSLIVPFINDKKKYYVFSLTSFGASTGASIPGSDPAAGRLYYSVVDMDLDSGFGDVVPGQKAIQIDSMLCDRLVAIQGSQCNVWLVAMRYDGTAIHAFEISIAGINPVPVVSPCNVAINPALDISPLFQLPGSGCMRGSPDNHKLAVGLSGLALDFGTFDFYGGGFQLYDFNNTTGVAGNQVNVLSPSNSLGFDQQVYSVCFSPDNSRLYLTHGLLLGLGLAQYDISSGIAATILASGTGFSDTTIGWGNGLRLGADDKIYISGLNMAALGAVPAYSLHRIEAPNAAVPAATLTLNAVPLAAGSSCYFSLGNAAPSDPPRDSFFSSVTLALCAPETSKLLSVPEISGYSYLWDNGATTNERTITGPGKYWVMYGPYCPKIIDTFNVIGVDVRFDLGRDTIICSQEFTLELKPGIAGAAYLWQDGSTAPSYQVTHDGLYSVTVSKMGCTASDQISIKSVDVKQNLGPDTLVCSRTPFSIRLEANAPEGAAVAWSTGATQPFIDVSTPGLYTVKVEKDGCEGYGRRNIGTELCDCIAVMPNAFSPNGDGLNDLFKPMIEPNCLVSVYEFRIFNRWGEEVFSTVKPGEGWDGTTHGQVQDGGTYMYTIMYEKGTRHRMYTKKGDLTLIR